MIRGGREYVGTRNGKEPGGPSHVETLDLIRKVTTLSAAAAAAAHSLGSSISRIYAPFLFALPVISILLFPSRFSLPTRHRRGRW